MKKVGNYTKTKLVCAVLLAFVLWTIMFSPWTAPKINFWWMMTGSALLLSGLTLFLNPGWWKGIRWKAVDVFGGLALAAALWGIFWVGDKAAAWMFDFARDQVDSIYGMKEGESPWLLTALMIFLIGPAEEIFWRGYVQKTLSDLFSSGTSDQSPVGGRVISRGPVMGYIAATVLYAAVHAGSLNFMLFAAAGVAGAVWGLFYLLFPKRLPLLIVSHALWDVAVFIWFPI